MRAVVASVRPAVAILLGLLGLAHLAFAVANLQFVVEIPANLDVAFEALAATVAGVALLWSAINHWRRRRWARIALVGGLVFTAGMVLSVSTGASTPSMLQVVVPVVGVSVAAWLGERVALRRSTATPSITDGRHRGRDEAEPTSTAGPAR